MNLRKRALSPGWYPENSGKIRQFLRESTNNAPRGNGLACIAPHAGWYYSGLLAAKSIHALSPNAGTVIIIGGHLPGDYPPLFAMENGFETPLGNVPADRELRDLLFREFSGRPDESADNTVEVLLPVAAYFFPSSKYIWMRLPASIESYSIGKKIASVLQDTNGTAVVIGSTDLTHYGTNYGFTPKGTGQEALEWVKQVNDASLIDAITAGDAEAVLERAAGDHSACSAGAILGAMGYARAMGTRKGVLAGYYTSADIEMAGSFVGYASVVWEK